MTTPEEETPKSLDDEIRRKRPTIKTDSYPMSIGELVNLYRDGDLDVHPEFQRIFRWTDSQKTRLVESILLGIPIPPIFVAQRDDGVWDVVDGVQRLSTILQFVGILKDSHGQLVTPLVMEETKLLLFLAGMTWEGGEKPFTKDHQRDFKRAKIDINIVLKESDEKSKYELFMRLNTGGTALEPQEVRNCLMIMAYPKTYEWVDSLAQVDDFRNAVSLSEQAVMEQYPMDLVTRFLIFRKMNQDKLSKVGDISDFLNQHLGDLDTLRAESREVEDRAFRETFRFINSELEDKAFKRYDQVKDRFLGGFLISTFEIIALGVGFNTNNDGGLKPINNFVQKVKDIWTESDVMPNTGSGVRASSRIPKIVPYGRKLFSK
jgi:hypothetical protein